MGHLEERLWSGSAVDAADPRVLLDQYALYVEMADRVSQRRGLTNTFFLTLNTTLLAGAGVLWTGAVDGPRWALGFSLAAVLGQCVAWFALVDSYRRLNAAKFDVVGAMEARLPAAPYRAEWALLTGRAEKHRHTPLSTLERTVPILFAVGYLAAFAVAVWS